MGKVLYRKYRSRQLSEIVGQPHITQALDQALKTQKVSHAYLFTGPRGTGKTSIARILAHEINGLPYSDENTHLDIIEIDAASNRGIEDVRELRDKVHAAPTSSKFKVYIIDEVHMLTPPAFNALLKTLEEPPAHVIFILATTEMHKMPDTIVSRTQHFAFKPVPQDQVVAHLKHIAQSEGLKIDDEALELVAAYGGGSFRDSISLLDQTRNYGDHVTADVVRLITGVAPATAIESIVSAIAEHRPGDIVVQLGAQRDRGVEASAIARQLVAYFEQDVLSTHPTVPPHNSLDIMRALIEIGASRNPEAALRICLLQAALEPTIAAHVAHAPAHNEPVTTVSQSKPAPKSSPRPAKSVTPAATTVTAAEPTAPQPVAESSVSTGLPDVDMSVATTTDEVGLEEWSAVMAHIKQKHNTLFSILKTAAFMSSPGKITLKVSSAFYQKRLNDAKNKTIIIEAIDIVTQRKMALDCVHEAGVAPTEITEVPARIAPAAADQSSPIGAISNIFGGAELLES